MSEDGRGFLSEQKDGQKGALEPGGQRCYIQPSIAEAAQEQRANASVATAERYEPVHVVGVIGPTAPPGALDI